MGKPAGLGVLRRALLRAGVSGTAMAAAAVALSMPKQEAGYQPTPRGGLSCAMCSLFRPPNRCEVVSGDISPDGWCRFFAMPD